MTGKERILATLAGQPPDRVPFTIQALVDMV